MRKIHNILYTIISVSTFVLTIFSLGLLKLIPVLEQRIYYCQAFIQSLSVQLFTNQINTLSFIVISVLFSFIFLKIFFALYRINNLKKNVVSSNNIPSVLKKQMEKYTLKKHVYLIEDIEMYAFCFGILHPKIYISTMLLKHISSKELEAILLHEKYHVDHKDSLRNILIYISKMIFAFFPFVSDLGESYKIRSEILADKAATDILGDTKPLLSVLRKMISASTFPSIAVAALADEALEYRIRTLITNEPYKKKFPLNNVVLSIFSFTILASVILSPTEKTEVCLTGTNCSVWCTTNASSIQKAKLNASYPYTPSH